MRYRSRIAAAILLGVMAVGCGYGEVSPQTYELAKAIYNVCNRQQTEKLPVVAGLIDSSLEEGKITEQEAGWLRDLIQQAEQGDWETATQKSRRMMEDQVKY